MKEKELKKMEKKPVCPYQNCRKTKSQLGVPFTNKSLQMHLKMAHRKEIKEQERELNSYSQEEAERLCREEASPEGLIMPDGTVIAPDGTELHNRAFISDSNLASEINGMVGFLMKVKLTYVEAETIISAARLAVYRGEISREERRENFSPAFPSNSLDKIRDKE